jgi:hypothetical protein
MRAGPLVATVLAVAFVACQDATAPRRSISPVSGGAAADAVGQPLQTIVLHGTKGRTYTYHINGSTVADDNGSHTASPGEIAMLRKWGAADKEVVFLEKLLSKQWAKMGLSPDGASQSSRWRA